MARIQPIVHTEDYTQTRERSVKRSEKNDCAVVAISIVTGRDYDDCHAALKKAGRIEGRGTYNDQSLAAIRELGFKVRMLGYTDLQRIIAGYPGRATLLKSVTSHHPRRYPECFADFQTSLWFTDTHVSAFKDGKLHDWAVNKALRIKGIWVVEAL